MTRGMRLLLSTLVIAVVITSAWALTGGGYDLTWNTVDGGGGMFSTGGTYELGGTIGQPDAGEMVGGTYTLNGGFWPGSLPLPVTITQWRSVRTHTGVGELGIPLNATATGTAVTTETRGSNVGGSAPFGVLKIQVDFSGPVTLVNAANITVTYRPTIQGGSPSIGSPVSVIPSSVVMADADTLNMIFTAGQLPNLGCTNISIGAGTFAETITGDTDCNIRVLAGDTNSSGTVNTTDQNQTKSNLGQPVDTAHARFDINLSGGSINTTDLNAVKAQVISPAKTALCP
jgi:hypothetical protein